MFKLDCYILKEVLVQFGLQIVVLCGLLLLSQLGRRSELFMVVGADFLGVLQVLGLVLLPFVSIVFPVGFLFAVLLSFRKFTMQGEWYAMQASGYGIMRASTLILTLATVLAAVCLMVSHIAEPWGFRKIEEVVFAGAQKQWDNVLGQTLQAGVFETSIPQWMVYAGTISEDRSRFKEFVLAPQKLDVTQNVRLYAPRAELKGKLKDGNLKLALFDGRFLRFQNGEQISIGFEEMELPLGAMLKDSFEKSNGSTRSKVQVLPTPELRKYIQRKKAEAATGKKSRRLSRAMTILALRTGIGLTILPLSLFGLIAGLVRRRSSRNNSYFWAIGSLLLCFGSIGAVPALERIVPFASETLVLLVLGVIFVGVFWLCLHRNNRAPRSA